MPDVYYTIASHELLDAARAYAADAIKDVSVYKVKLDYIDVQERGLKLRPGQRVRLMSDEYFASGYYDSRITRITRNISYPDELSVDISAVRVIGTLSRLQASIQKTENVVAQFSGQLPAIIKSNDDTSADDSSVYTSAKSEKEFLNKRKGGKVAAPVTFDEVAEFLNGLVAHKYIKIGNGYLRYNDELGVWEMEGDLAVTGNVAWFASIKGFKPSTIMDAVQVDGETIVKNELGQLKVIGGGSGGSGGGLTVSDLSNYLTTNKYTKQSDVVTLISTALTPYALTAAIPTNNNQLSNGAGYITAAALNGYATQSWVEGKKYLTGITSSQVTTALGYTPYNSNNPDKYIKDINSDMVIAALGYTPYSTTNPMGYLTISSLLGYATEQWVGDNYLASSNFTKANIKSSLGISDWALAASKPSYTAAEVGAYIGNGSTIPNGEDLANLQAGSYWVYENLGAASVVKLSYSSLVVLGNSYYSPQMNISHNAQQAYIRGVYNTGTGNSVSDWHELAFTDSNVASATKLQTPRTIWGQSFDGTGNVGGVLMNFTQITADASQSYGIFRGDFFSANLTPNDLVIYNPFIGLSGNVVVGGTTADAKLHVHGDAKITGGLNLANNKIYWNEVANYSVGFGQDNNDTPPHIEYKGYSGHRFFSGAQERMRILTNGNVVFGGTIADAKLHVYGNGLFDNTLSNTAWVSDTGQLIIRSTSTNYHLGFGVASNGLAAIQGGNRGVGAISLLLNPNGGNVVIGGTTASAKFHVHGNAQIDGDVLVNGNFSWITQSQRSLKHIISEQGLSLAQLELIKPIKFYWKDGRDAALHVGGVADVFDEVLPEVVARNKGVLCLNYVDAAFYVGASLIAPVLDHERRITGGERERETLKKEYAALKRELAIMKQMLNQLPA